MIFHQVSSEQGLSYFVISGSTNRHVSFVSFVGFAGLPLCAISWPLEFLSNSFRLNPVGSSFSKGRATVF
jgi:hypothetical protein